MFRLASSVSSTFLNGHSNFLQTFLRPPLFVLEATKRYITKKTYQNWPVLDEADIEEKFMRGWGPGGQAVAKTNNCVQLKHKPTGIIIKNHATRSLSENRKLARETLVYKLDILYNKEESFDAIKKREDTEKYQKAYSRAKKRLSIKKEFKARLAQEKEKSEWFKGLMIDTKLQSFTDPEEYDAKLTEAIPNWQSRGDVRGFWAKIALEHTNLTSVFAKHGLNFHHAQPGYVMMMRWIPTTEPCIIPEYAHNYLGVGGFVVNSKNELLVIKEKFHPGKSPKWKLPGGHADMGEEIMDTAVREVREETGIDSEFIGILTFRHQKDYKYGCSDFYFICLLRPTREDQVIKKCDQEIGDCRWMDLDEYMNDVDITDTNKFICQCYKEAVQGNAILRETPVLSFNKNTLHNIYKIKSLSEKPEREVGKS